MKKADVPSDEKTFDAFIADPQKSISDAEILACCGLTGYSALREIVRREGPIGMIGMGGLGLSQLRAAVYPP